MLKNSLNEYENKIIALRMWTCPEDGPEPGVYALWNFFVINQPTGEGSAIYNYCKIIALDQNTNGSEKRFYIGYFQSSGDLSWSVNIITD